MPFFCVGRVIKARAKQQPHFTYVHSEQMDRQPEGNGKLSPPNFDLKKAMSNKITNWSAVNKQSVILDLYRVSENRWAHAFKSVDSSPVSF